MMGRNDNVERLQSTLQVLEEGEYSRGFKTISLKLSSEEMETVRVFLPKEVQDICNKEIQAPITSGGYPIFGCENVDAFSLARKRMEEKNEGKGHDSDILVLNLANPVNPGGGVRRGARAQEEDLCRCSSLLRSLESEAAKRYYEYNRGLNTYMGSDAVLITPKVEIIRDENGDLLEETVIVSVLTCAAPMITYGKEGMSESEYEQMVYHRIDGILKCAAYLGYTHLILGAWGCGAFANDAHVISGLFYNAINNLDYNGLKASDLFHRIEFAILDRSDHRYNFNEFNRFFNPKVNRSGDKKNIWLDGVMGVVVGDALGCPVQFINRSSIRKNGLVTGMRGYGTYNMPPGTWTDDSSMTLALLASIREKKAIDLNDIMERFVEWLYQGEYTPYGRTFDQGRTCSTAISAYKMNKDPYSCGGTSEQSNGNGSLMRILPACLYAYANKMSVPDAIHIIHEVSGLTHNHPRSHIGCGLYYFCVCSILDGEGSIAERLQDGLDNGFAFYKKDDNNHDDLMYYGSLRRLSEFAALSEDNIKGSGYVVDSLEAAIWSILNSDSFASALLKAVNLGDDTDTVAAIAGGLAGLYYGYDSIPDAWLDTIPRREWIEELCLS